MKSLAKMRRMIWLFSKFKVPMIGYAKPKLIHIDDHEVVIQIKLRRRTKNHLNSMYFGVLAIGADVSGGLHSFYHADKLKAKVSVSFKSFQANFIKRAEGDVTFVCKDGMVVREVLERGIANKERVNQNLRIEAFTDYPTKPDKVADFVIELSVKAKS